MSQALPYDEIKDDRIVKIEAILDTDDESDIGFSVECDSLLPDNIKEETKYFPFSPEKEYSDLAKF